MIAYACAPSRSDNPNDIRFQQYFVQGEELYVKHCSNCHQKNGRGLGRVYPPLDTSDYVDNNFREVLCLMRNGKSGSVVVNGKEFVQAMPGIPALTDIEIAEIATYLYNSWSHKRGIIEVQVVTQELSACTH